MSLELIVWRKTLCVCVCVCVGSGVERLCVCLCVCVSGGGRFCVCGNFPNEASVVCVCGLELKDLSVCLCVCVSEDFVCVVTFRMRPPLLLPPHLLPACICTLML